MTYDEKSVQEALEKGSRGSVSEKAGSFSQPEDEKQDSSSKPDDPDTERRSSLTEPGKPRAKRRPTARKVDCPEAVQKEREKTLAVANKEAEKDLKELGDIDLALDGKVHFESVVVVGAGLAGLSAACALLEKGCAVTILEKHSRAGGASSKATCGIAAPASSMQQEAGITDDFKDLLENAEAKALCKQGSEAVDWLIDALNLKPELDLVDVPSHPVKRVIGAKENFPGAVITYKTLQMLQRISKSRSEKVNIICEAEVTKLLKSEDDDTKIVGVEYRHEDEIKIAKGPVVLATGGYTGDLSSTSVLAKNVEGYASMANAIDGRASGDGISLAVDVGAEAVDLEKVSMYPLGVNVPGREEKPFKMCVADALCGAGAIILDKDGERTMQQDGSSDCRVSQMMKDGGQYYVVMSEAISQKEEVQFLVKFYEGKFFTLYGGPASFARTIGVAPAVVKKSIPTGPILAAPITPVLHTSLGGVSTGFEQGDDGGCVLDENGEAITGLYAAGEVTNVPYPRIWSQTGIPLLHAVFTGKMAGDAAAASTGHTEKVSDLSRLAVPEEELPEGEKELESMTKEELIEMVKALEAGGAAAGGAPAEPAGPPPITMEDVAKHKSKDDAWIVLFGNVYDVTNWIPKHPGGEQAIQVFLGMDATEEWQNIHKPGTLENKNYNQHFTKVGALGTGKPAGGAAAPKSSGGITIDEVKKHTTKEAGLWIVINGMVLDVTEFVNKHPGGEPILVANCGNDASTDWNGIHKPGTVEKWLKMEGGPKLVGNFDGAVAAVPGGAGAAPEEEWLVIDGEGRVPGIIGSAIYLVINLARMLLRTIFFTGNFKFSLDNNRKGTIQSAMMLLLFTVIHAGGNFTDMILNKSKSANGEGETLKRAAGGDLGLLLYLPYGYDLSFLEIYIILALMIHVTVALKRSYDISINYCLYTGKWNMMISGLFTLGFLIKHLSDIKFGKTNDVWVRLPKYLIDLPPHLFYEEYGSDDNGLFGSVCRKVRDVYSTEVILFKDNLTVAFYTLAILFFVYHMVRGWEKLVTAEMMQIPTGHVKRVTYLGWLLAVAVGSMYMTVLWFTYFATPDIVSDDPTCLPKTGQ